MASGPKAGSFKDLVSCLLDTALPCLGEEICYRPHLGGAYTVNAVFDDDYIGLDPDTEEMVSGQQPRIGVKLSDLPYLPTNKDLVTIGKRTFRVIDPREDGQGGATLFLNEVEK